MEPSDNSQRVQTWPSLLLRSGTHQKSIILPTIDPGFKPALSLCTDTSLVDEPWKPSVAKKILAAYYTPLSLKSELLATKAALNEFQSLAMQEAVMAFHDIAFHNNITIKQGRSNFPDVGPKTIVKACRRVKGFRRLLDDDKVTLLSSGLLDVMVLRSVLLYDHLTDSWSCSGSRFARNDVFQDLSLLIGLTRVIETFPDRWRKDLTVACLIYLIIIFNPDLPYLQFSGSIRQEQYTYIYLLQRYLEMACKSPCDASDYHYRLMAKIEDIQNLRRDMQKFCEVLYPNFSILKSIATLVKFKITCH
ncbi:uncharacterized protein LOC107372050 [Tetranychus urticae]|uniref:uncharacterized protein LOC107372050 n=1 Tax=Tetranychus urticae TaxID=32264 RepID=UPI00077BBA92|nr:uncharacterized protein LOC107372050 [Tetranychus urticae]